uniref:Ion_trans domain-containing protein n=1 Tax=Steinernema glaseri TaxID=37863 RepID=A0A1I7Y660_9BILA
MDSDVEDPADFFDRYRCRDAERDLLTLPVPPPEFFAKYRQSKWKLFKEELHRFRAQVYNFLERPKGTLSFVFHLVVFTYIVLVHSFSALSDLEEYDNLYITVQVMEISLAIYFTVEFFVRLWAVAADSKYQGFKGRLRYLRRLVCIIDVIILIVTFLMLAANRSFLSSQTIEKLRFLQILRLFHIDRQMSTWKMIKDMIMRSRYELFAAYFITFMLFLLLATTVYTIESVSDDAELAKLRKIDPNATVDRTFATYGSSMWFSVVSFTTIGYGDIVPKHWISKFLTCFLGYAAICMFAAVSMLVGVGMTLLLENENRMHKQSKVKNMAARLIQTWYRFHLISDEERFYSIMHYRKLCMRVSQVEERIRKARNLATKAKEFKKKRLLNPINKLRKKSMQLPEHLDEKIASSGPIRKTSVTTELPPMHPGRAVKRNSLALPSRSAMPERLFARRHSAQLGTPAAIRHSASVESEMSEMTQSVDGSIISLEFSDEERILDYYYDPYAADSRSVSHRSETSEPFDEMNMPRYRNMLRMLYFFMFITLKKKFHRARKPYELMDAEAELCEMEHQRKQKFKELELRIDATIGKVLPSPLNPPGQNKASLQKRLQICETKLEEMERKLRFITHLSEQIGKAIQGAPPT